MAASSPLPTPHPLKPFASFAYEPSWVEIIAALGILGAALVLIFAVLARSERLGRRDFRNSLSTVCAELERIAASATLAPKDALATASESVKRLLASLELFELRQMNAGQIEKFSHESAPPYSRALLLRIVALDTARFQRDLTHDTVLTLLSDLPTIVRETVQQHAQLIQGSKR